MYGTKLTDALKNNLQAAAVNAVGAKLAAKIGKTYRSSKQEGADKALQLISHAVLGCGLGVGLGGECAGGAVGAVAGEVAGEAYLNHWLDEKLTDPNTVNLSPAALEKEIRQLQEKGINIGRLAGGLAALATGSDADSAVATAANAVDNNVLCAGACISALVVISAIYTTQQGDGNILDGLEEIGKGDDALSQAIRSGVSKAVELSYEQYPEATASTLKLLASVGKQIDATVTYINDLTGNTASSQWNALDETTQKRIIGAGKVFSVVLPAVSVAKITQFKRFASKADVTKGGGKYLNDSWYKGTFPNKTQSLKYHLGKHGKGRTATEYTKDAMNFFGKNSHLGKKVTLKDGTPGIKIQTKTKVDGKTQQTGGYWTQDGKLVTFWD